MRKDKGFFESQKLGWEGRRSAVTRLPKPLAKQPGIESQVPTHCWEFKSRRHTLSGLQFPFAALCLHLPPPSCYYLRLLQPQCCPHSLHSQGPFSSVNALMLNLVAPLDKEFIKFLTLIRLFSTVDIPLGTELLV